MADAILSLRPNRAPSESRALPYKGKLPHPFADVRIKVGAYSGLVYEYAGAEQTLIACGAVTAELLSQPRHSKHLDEKSQTVCMHRKRKQGLLLVTRFRDADDDQLDLPGAEPWMLDALRRQIEEREQEQKRRQDEEAAAAAASRGPIYGVLSPAAFRAHLIEQTEDQISMLRYHIDLDPRFVQLQEGYQLHTEDMRTYRARMEAAIDELTDMARKMRIVQTRPASGLRLVIDNTREVRR
jgi:hypothetical protein